MAFQDDIPRFAEAFEKASVYSIWRSMGNKFLFAYSKDLKRNGYFESLVFKSKDLKKYARKSYNDVYL